MVMVPDGTPDQHYRLRMSDDVPPPPSEAPVPPPPAPESTPPPPPPVSAAPGYVAVQGGRVPERLGGPYYSIGVVILLMIVTLGIWGIFWTWRNTGDLKRYNGDGLGSGLSLVIYLLLNVVLMFTIPNEVKNLYERDGRQSPVSALWGLWFLLPLVGHIIWYVKVQHALNDFWLSKGAQAG
jgi:Domain of unknown function (DUF4234)